MPLSLQGFVNMYSEFVPLIFSSLKVEEIFIKIAEVVCKILIGKVEYEGAEGIWTFADDNGIF